MSILYQNEHFGCFNYDRSEKPQIEVKRVAKGDTGILSLKENEIVFVTEGRIRFVSNDFSSCEGLKGQMLFLPAGGNYSFGTLTDSAITIFRFYESIRLCDNFDLENLNEEKAAASSYQPRMASPRILNINILLWHYLDGLNDLIEEGMRCRSFFQIKIKELLLLLHSFYTKKELQNFFSPILSDDMAFSEYVRLHWKDFHTVTELANSMHMTHKQFYNRFIPIFGTRPQRWMNEGRARIIHNEITSTRKQFKLIAAENGFASDTHFTRFCKKELGKTPTEVRHGKTHVGDNVK